MRRNAPERRTPNVPRVEKIELSEKYLGLRVALVFFLLAIGITAIVYGINAIFSTPQGWQEIEADSRADINCSQEFVFLYELGVSGVSATAENKAITALYTEVCVEAYELFHEKETFEGVNNVCYINMHPNEVIEVEEVLYQAFETIKAMESRYLYLAPVYVRYDDIFVCVDDSQLVDFDPYISEEVAAEYAGVAAYAMDAGAVDVLLLGDNKIKLYVSDAYLQYAEENYITDFIDFAWMKNAFVVDYLADTMLETGYTRGTISSYDGFVRNLDDSGESYSLNIFTKTGGKTYQVAVMEYTGAKSFVNLRSFPINEMDENRYYELENGEIRTFYLDVEDGRCKCAVNTLISYSAKKSCAELALLVAPVFIADNLKTEALTELSTQGIHSVYCQEDILAYTEDSLTLKDIE